MPKKLYILFFSSFLVMAGYGLLIPVQVVYSQSIGISEMQYGIALGLFAAMQLISTPVFGKLSDSHGRTKFILIALLLFAVADLTLYFGETYETLLFARALNGISAGMLIPAINGYITDATDENSRTKAMM